mgnify:CR=1 FL=1
MGENSILKTIGTASETISIGLDMASRGNANLLKSFLGPAYDGFMLEKPRGKKRSHSKTDHDICYNWSYEGERGDLNRLYQASKSAQWNAATDIDWNQLVDPLNTKNPILPDRFCPAAPHAMWRRLTPAEQAVERQSLLAWLLSQILHGEQGALYATSQIMQMIPWIDGKLFSASQIFDEARHVEIFHKYLTEKLQKRYEINDNLYVLIEMIMRDERWDVKFLGMQILVEGFGLGAFRAVRVIANEPLLKNILQKVIVDEARHVHYGVLALQEYYKTLTAKEIMEREDMALEICILLKKRFLAHEIYHEFYTDKMSLAEWNRFAYESELMQIFRNSMFDLILPNLEQIGILTERVKPMYLKEGLITNPQAKSAPYMKESDYELNL